jgi:cytochrome c oxidase subunit 4
VLVLLYFMHVADRTPLVWVFAFGGFLWLGILLVLTFSDYVTRMPGHDI